jgi:pimeloyl-ACP methyl ester carboxylesterase
MSESTIDVDGVDVFYRDEGEGDPVLLLHGFPDTGDLWHHQVRQLTANGFRAIVPDLRGFGRSGKPPGVAAYRVQAVINDMWGLLRHLGLSRVHVVGHDWGAELAWVMAAISPRRVDHLAVLSAGHPAEFVRPSIHQREQAWYMLLYQFEGVAEELLTRDNWQLFTEMLRSQGDIEAHRPHLTEPGALTPALNWYRANVGPRFELAGPPRLPTIAAPTLGLWSTDDRSLTEEAMLHSGRHVSGPWVYERVIGANHWIPLDAPDTVSDLLLGFLGHFPTPVPPARALARPGRRR